MIQNKEGHQGSTDVQYTCRCSFLQIYKEHISDLLHATDDDRSLPLRSDSDSGVFVEGLSDHVIVNGAPPASPSPCTGASTCHCLPTRAPFACGSPPCEPTESMNRTRLGPSWQCLPQVYTFPRASPSGISRAEILAPVPETVPAHQCDTETELKARNRQRREGTR